MCFCLLTLALAGLPGVADETAASPRAERFAVEDDEASETTTITVPSAGGRVAMDDVVRALVRAGRLDDRALPGDLPSRPIDLNSPGAVLAIIGLNAVLPPDVRVGVARGTDEAPPGLRITIDRAGLRARTREIKGKLRERLGNADVQFGLVLDEDWRERDATRPVVVLIHGFESDPESLSGLRSELRGRGWTCAAFSYPNDGPLQDSGELLASELRAFRAAHPERRVVIVAHSMGGLVARVAIEDPALDPGNVERLILVAAPNQGSRLAELPVGFDWLEHAGAHVEGGPKEFLGRCFADGCDEARSDLCPDSAFLRALNQRERNPRVRYSLLLGTRGPLSAAQVKEFQRRVTETVNAVPPAGLLRPRLEDGLHDLDELVAGKGDGAVAVERGKLAGVEDTVLLPFSHLTITHKPTTSTSGRELLEAILDRLENDGAADKEAIGPASTATR
jgi:pimeloyl-ACP methyl ester carboxylesterase